MRVATTRGEYNGSYTCLAWCVEREERKIEPVPRCERRKKREGKKVERIDQPSVHKDDHISPATNWTFKSSSSSMIFTRQSVSGLDTQRSA